MKITPTIERLALDDEFLALTRACVRASHDLRRARSDLAAYLRRDRIPPREAHAIALADGNVAHVMRKVSRP